MIPGAPSQSAAFGRARIELSILHLDDPELGKLDELPPVQRRRATELATPNLARRYVAAQVGLRRQLGHRLDVPPSEVRLITGTFGKPMLAPGAYGVDLRFNLAHSADLALVACAVGVDVGVDVEICTELSSWGGPAGASSVLSAGERAALAALPEHDRAQRFLRFWVRKEAVLKAAGTGLSVQLPLVDTAPQETDTNGSVALAWRGSAQERIWWQDIALDEPRAVAAIACGAPRFELVRMRTQP